MQHRIPIGELRSEIGPQIEEMARAVSACVHCGFCLPTCPTYRLLGEEMDSPRGRIVLMKEALEGGVELEAMLPHIDACLGCEACETSCPSGVRYGELLTPFREIAERRRRRTLTARAFRRLLLRTLASPRRFRLVAWAGRAMRPLRGILPSPLAAGLDLLPPRLPRSGKGPPALTTARGERRARVALLAGCVERVLRPSVLEAAVEVLTYHGVEVVIPPQQGCCGSLALHAGEGDLARSLARRNLAAFPGDVDAILTTAAGCGSGMRSYPLLFEGRAAKGRASAFAARVRDVSSFLDGLEVRWPELEPPARVAYHDPCHLAHAQRERLAPRRLLAAVGATLVEPAAWEVCCGSAGIYNLEHGDLAARLGEAKAGTLLATGAEILVSGNIGCLVQIERHLERLGEPRPLLHTVELLARACAGPGARGLRADPRSRRPAPAAAS